MAQREAPGGVALHGPGDIEDAGVGVVIARRGRAQGLGREDGDVDPPARLLLDGLGPAGEKLLVLPASRRHEMGEVHIDFRRGGGGGEAEAEGDEHGAGAFHGLSPVI